LATDTDGLLRGGALIDLWKRGYVEPVQAPPKPFHVLAQQLMALVLQEKGVGRTQWYEWVSKVPGFSSLPGERVDELVENMIQKGFLWSDGGILAFAPEGEATFGRRHFMEILSVFTSPPLFTVMSGQKEIGSVDETTFYKREEGPPVIVLGGRYWQTRHIDWKRRIAHAEPTTESGSSRWMGAGRMLSQEVSQGIRRILSADEPDATWSLRAIEQFTELRNEMPWVSLEHTSLVRDSDGQVAWWTFAGGIANTLLANALTGHCDAKGNNLSITFQNTQSLQAVAELIAGIDPAAATPIPNPEMMESLKFGECLSPGLALDVFGARFQDDAAVKQALDEPRRDIVVG
jgi:ATP-dependent Lhr-like helicase